MSRVVPYFVLFRFIIYLNRDRVFTLPVFHRKNTGMTVIVYVIIRNCTFIHLYLSNRGINTLVSYHVLTAEEFEDVSVLLRRVI